MYVVVSFNIGWLNKTDPGTQAALVSKHVSIQGFQAIHISDRNVKQCSLFLFQQSACIKHPLILKLFEMFMWYDGFHNKSWMQKWIKAGRRVINVYNFKSRCVQLKPMDSFGT